MRLQKGLIILFLAMVMGVSSFAVTSNRTGLPVAEICLGRFSHEPQLDSQFQTLATSALTKRGFLVLKEINEQCQVTLSGDVYAELAMKQKGVALFGRPSTAMYNVKANLVQNQTGDVLWQQDFGTPKFSIVAKKDQMRARAEDMAQSLKNYYQTKGRISF